MASDQFTILIAEDSPDDQALIRRAVQRAGVTQPMQFVSDGQEAIDYLNGEGKYSNRIQFPFPGFIITDLKMPLKSGFEVLQWLLEHPEWRIVPIIVLSASAEPEDIKRCYQLSANTYFQKPTEFNELEQMFRVITEYWCLAERADVPTRA